VSPANIDTVSAPASSNTILINSVEITTVTGFERSATTPAMGARIRRGMLAALTTKAIAREMFSLPTNIDFATQTTTADARPNSPSDDRA
jgi:hypothetical protein